MKPAPIRTCIVVLSVIISLKTLAAIGAEPSFEVSVAAGDIDRTNTPVKVDVALSPALKNVQTVELSDGADLRIVGQLTKPGLLNAASDSDTRELHFVVPELKKGESLKLTATATSIAAEESFSWKDTPGKFTDLFYGEKPVMRYMYESLDESRREETYKVFHHVYDPSGQQIVTKGPGGRYTHHRGLFFGFNRVSYDGKKADIWHCRGAHQAHDSVLATEQGPVVARHRVLINWHGPDAGIFASETREMTVYHVPGGNMIEFASHLESQVGAVKLDGDPQHAGFHFRASNEVAEKTSGQTYYVRPDGKDAPKKTRNWPGNKEHVDLEFNAMSFVVGGQRYTCCYLDRPENPKQARFSERDYGRFGSYFEYTLDNDNPLNLNYRIWLQEGEMDVEQVRAKSKDFVDPPKAAVKAA